ncbi:hypothetical protein M0R45_000272 [Rubus argutus]|uniref:Uncharacterized protein n=1 Tax=Rubus argutus TaxID=59490 RepID=A0AAW1VQN6_RUBAR
MDAGAPLAGIVAEEESSRELELGTTTAAAQRERERRGSMGTAAHDLGAAVVGESILDRWRLKFSAVSRHWWIDADGGGDRRRGAVICLGFVCFVKLQVVVRDGEESGAGEGHGFVIYRIGEEREARVMMKVMIGWTGGRIQGRQLKVEVGSIAGIALCRFCD